MIINKGKIPTKVEKPLWGFIKVLHLAKQAKHKTAPKSSEKYRPTSQIRAR